jgi:acetyl-CoA synthetase
MGDLESIETIVVVQATNTTRPMTEGADVWFHEAMEARTPSAPPSRSTPSTRCSSSTRRARRPSPRASCTRAAATSPGVAYTHKLVFDLKPETDVYWCSADVGLDHRALLHRLRAARQRRDVVMYEGAPDYPAKDIWWEMSSATA